MQVDAFERRVTELVQELATYLGYRTLWLSPAGEICPSEPDDEWEDAGFTYLTTLMRPREEDLACALTPLVPLELERDDVRSWRPSALLGAQLLPAQA